MPDPSPISILLLLTLILILGSISYFARRNPNDKDTP